jgi:WYL domain-containing protein
MTTHPSRQPVERQSDRDTAMQLLLIWEGHLSRSRLMDLLDLGETRASQWIREFREAHLGWVNWDAKSKSHVATSLAYKAFHGQTRTVTDQANALGHYLALVGAPTSPFHADNDTWLAIGYPEVTCPNPRMFSTLRKAAVSGRLVRATYPSIEVPKPAPIDLAPHTIVRNHGRWYVRGYCLQTDVFDDFVIGRFSDVVMGPPNTGKTKDGDVGWNTLVSVRIAPHPALEYDQALVVRREYFDDVAGRTDSCRACAIPYFLETFRIATNPETQRPPKYVLVVDNMEDVQPWIK